MIRALSLALSMAMAATPLTTQTPAKPDFSGQWTSAPDPGAPPAGRGRGAGDMGSGWGPTLRIAQTATQLTVEYAFYGRGDMQPPMKFTFALDGAETTNTVLAGHGMQQQRSKAAWDGEKLVITTQHSFTDPATNKTMPATMVQTLSLAAPASLVVDVVRKGVLGGPDTTSKTTYRKQ